MENYLGQRSISRTSTGALVVTNGKKLNRVIKLDLSIERVNDPVFVSAKEITVAIVDNPINISIDDAIESKTLTIENAVSIEANMSCFYISNKPSSGKAEIWIWE